MLFPLKNPTPCFQGFVKVLEGDEKPDRVHFVELGVDYEIMEFLLRTIMGKRLPLEEFENIREEKLQKFKEGKKMTLLTEEEERIFMEYYIEFFYRMGYDYMVDWRPLECFKSMVMPRQRVGKDTAALSKKSGRRRWAEENQGVISSWDDFERFPWEKMKIDFDSHYDFISRNLPEGMKIVVQQSLCHRVSDQLLGQEGLCYLLYDQPDLVKAVFDNWGGIVYEFYKDVISLECVGGIFHPDDLGHKSGTMISPKALRELVFPWFKKYSSLAHQHGKPYWYHCCGNVSEVMEDLIEEVKIDAFHSFQDIIISVGDFQKKYGDRVATLGGVDLDKLCRFDEKNLRSYVRKILDECMPRGRYALGSGNTIANYVPIKNYLAMLEEGLNWGKV